MVATLVTTIGALLLLAAQQAQPSSISFDALRAAVAQAAAISPDRVQELTVDWTAFAGAPGDVVAAATAVPVNRFQIRNRRAIAGPPPHDRNPELSTDQLVVVGADAAGAPLSWQLIRDPRIVRAEHPGPDGVLAGEVLMRADTQLLIALPDSAHLTDVRVYQPQWNGSRWSLGLIASFSVGSVR